MLQEILDFYEKLGAKLSYTPRIIKKDVDLGIPGTVYAFIPVNTIKTKEASIRLTQASSYFFWKDYLNIDVSKEALNFDPTKIIPSQSKFEIDADIVISSHFDSLNYKRK